MEIEDKPKVNEGKIFMVWIGILVIMQALLGDNVNGVGAAMLLILMGAIILIVAAPLHIYFAKKNKVSNVAGHGIIVFMILLLAIVVFFVLAMTGLFNFV